jgi:hypothetical protein
MVASKRFEFKKELNYFEVKRLGYFYLENDSEEGGGGESS